MLKIFQHTIQKFYSDDYTQAVDSFKNSFKKFLNDYSSPDKRQKLAIEKMRNNVGAVLASKPAQVAFEKRRSGVSSFWCIFFFFSNKLNRNLKSCTARMPKIVYTRIRSPSFIQPISKIMLGLQPPSRSQYLQIRKEQSPSQRHAQRKKQSA